MNLFSLLLLLQVPSTPTPDRTPQAPEIRSNIESSITIIQNSVDDLKKSVEDLKKLEAKPVETKPVEPQVQRFFDTTQGKWAEGYPLENGYWHAIRYLSNNNITNNNTEEGEFVNWLNGVRATYGLTMVIIDPNLTSWAYQNNLAQLARGMGHFIIHPARRQNAAFGQTTVIQVGNDWMTSSGHRDALLDPTITRIGLSHSGTYWTFDAQ